MKQKRVFSVLLALCIAAALSGCADKAAGADSSAEAAGVAVQVTTVGEKTISTENKVSGKIAADSESSIFVASSAKCTAVYVQAGDRVEKGDKICALDLASAIAAYNAANITYQSTVQSYEDQKAILDQQISMAEDNLNNLKALLEIGAAAPLEVDSAALSLQQAKAGRDSALAQLEAGMQSGKSSVEQLSAVMENVDGAGNVIAPASGTLVSLSAAEGGYVSPSMPVAVIDGGEQMKVTVSVSEALVPKLAIGDEADVTVTAINTTFPAAIRAVEKAASLQTKLYTVTLSVPAEVSGLLSGMFADVTFRTDTSADAVVVPTEAILTRNGVEYVYVVEGDAARAVEIQTGLTGSGVTEVTSGLTAGAKLVTVGQAYLSDGDPVRVVEQEG